MSVATVQTTIVRTDKGLTVQGTRITLYQIMDYVRAGASPEIIRDDFYLTVRQTDDILNYIWTHYDEVEAEYMKIVSQAEDIKNYWTEHNKDRLEKIKKLPQKPEYKIIRAKLRKGKSETAHSDNDIS